MRIDIGGSAFIKCSNYRTRDEFTPAAASIIASFLSLKRSVAGSTEEVFRL